MNSKRIERVVIAGGDGVGRLIELFPDRDFHPRLAAEFNRRMARQYESIRDFLILHYKLTQRAESEFWLHCMQMSIPDTLRHQIELFGACGRIALLDAEGFAEPSWVALLLGLGAVPQALDPFVDVIGEPQLRTHFAGLRQAIADTVAPMPDHADYIVRHVKADRAPEPAAAQARVPAGAPA